MKIKVTFFFKNPCHYKIKIRVFLIIISFMLLGMK